MITPIKVTLQSRDFTLPILTHLPITPGLMSWSAFGGPDQAQFTIQGPPEKIFRYSDLLRCPVTFTDNSGVPVWWGYVDEIVLYLDQTEVKISLEPLFNKVKVTYSFISPDNKVADQLDSGWGEDLVSQSDYGLRETIIHRTNLDEDFATNLRDTFLEQYALPKSQLSQRFQAGTTYAHFHCSGWFKTLGWKYYSSPNGFYAHYGPGPGGLDSGRVSTRRTFAQRFTALGTSKLKYAYFMLRYRGAPTQNLYARLYAEHASLVTPGTLLATSSPVNATLLTMRNYTWVRFTFPTPYTMASGTNYWVAIDPNAIDASNYIMVRIDESGSFNQAWHHAKYYTGSGWALFTSTSFYDCFADLYFRAVCVEDTGQTLYDIATSANQFFSRIITLTTGVEASPYRAETFSAEKEITKLLHLGTSNNRLVLARVTPERQLHFYEQPAAARPTVYMDKFSRFYSLENLPIKPYNPPVGQYAQFTGSASVSLPWDVRRFPTCFIHGAEYNPLTGQVKIHSV